MRYKHDEVEGFFVVEVTGNPQGVVAEWPVTGDPHVTVATWSAGHR